MPLIRPVLLASLSLGASPVAAANTPLQIDGRLDEPIWAQALVFSDFVVTEPWTLAEPTLPTVARLLSTPEGIAIGFALEHPPEIPRVVERSARDADQVGDRVNVYIDFDANGQVAYNFTVGLSGAVQDATWTNEVVFSADWDANWQHAVHVEPERWSVEILIPWTVAPMRDSGAPSRTIGVLFDRFLAARRERSASAAASWRRPRFVSELPRVEIPQYAASSLELFPYLTLIGDLVGGGVDPRAGADLFWKPSGDFQLSAALNPDFGQVEADELVVNFEAIEAFRSDKRPFFTENQALFDLRTPDAGQLVYTRRIGGPRDDDPSRAADIDAAVKLGGSWRGLGLGLLAAVESEYANEVGSAFLVQRIVRPGPRWTLGWLRTATDRPFLDRRASVDALDASWRPNPSFLLNTQLIASRIGQDGSRRTGHGAWLELFVTPSPAWQHELELTRFDRQLDFNDLGFLRRADLEQVVWMTTWNRLDHGPDSRLRSSRWRIEPQIRRNTAGDRLPPVLSLDQRLNDRSGAQWSWQLRMQGAGIDDLLTRGNGNVRLPPRHAVELDYDSPRLGNAQFELEGQLFQEGLRGWARQLTARGRWAASEQLSLAASLRGIDSPDWLIWRRGGLLGQFERQQLRSSLEADWFPAPAHELRARLEWIGLRASRPRAWRVGRDARLLPSEQTLAPFSLNTLGLQLRYRWSFASQSDLFVVYARGGETLEQRCCDGLGDLFFDALRLRDTDQLVLKLRWAL